MERTDILELMSTLKLYGMRAAYDEVMTTGIKRRHEPPRIVGDLLNAEIAEKQARSIKYQLSIAKLPLAKDIDDFDFTGTPVNQALIRDLATGAFLAEQRNAVLIGGTGTGKSHLAIAIARACIRGGARGRFYTVIDLVNRLENEARASRQGRLAEYLTRMDFIILGEHGDLLDLIGLNRNLRLGEAIDEARSFLVVPRRSAAGDRAPPPSPPALSGSSEAGRRLFRAGRPIAGTPAEAYLRVRGIVGPLDWPALHYHPSVFYRETKSALLEIWPALLAAVTDVDGRVTGIQRTWLDPLRLTKAPLADPRRALGHLLGNGVRFGKASNVLAAGEGLETMLALKSVLPLLPMIAALSANHLAALELPPTLRRLYVARDNDAAGIKAAVRLRERGTAAGIEIRDLVPVHADFNLDLRCLGPAAMLEHLAGQLDPSDLARFGSCDRAGNAGR
jgi:hypothetical protein